MKIHEGKTLAQNNKSSKVALESSSREAYESCDRAAAFTFFVGVAAAARISRVPQE